MNKIVLVLIVFSVLFTTLVLGQVNAYDRYVPSGIGNYIPSSRYNNQPRVQKYYVKNYSEYNVKNYLDYNSYNLDPVEGIWQSTDGFKYAIEKNVGDGNRVVTSNYRMVVLSASSYNNWNLGDIKAFIELNGNGVYSIRYYTGNENAYFLQNCIGFLENSMLFTFTRSDNNIQIGLAKLYPDEIKKQKEREETDRKRIMEVEQRRQQEEKIKQEQKETERKKAEEEAVSSGTGFALSSNGYIATNYHVVKKAQSIEVRGVNGDLSKKYWAEIVVVDEQNDLAIIKINDPDFVSLGSIPYTFRSNTAEAGENVFTLGYPLTEILGKEIKLTNGIINSKTGFQGNISNYQISVPIQPGNSGGPLFDKYGNLIGIITSGIKRELNLTENVNYAVKISYLKKLIESLSLRITMPQTNMLRDKNLSDQTKLAARFTYMILINTKKELSYENSISNAGNSSDYRHSNVQRNYKIAFYNVENYFDCSDDLLKTDEEYLPGGIRGWNVTKYHKKQTNIGRVIGAIGGWDAPAIVGLCEVESEKCLVDLTLYSEMKEMKYKFLHHESPDVRGIDVALLYQPKQFKPIHDEAIRIRFPFAPSSKTRDILYTSGIIPTEDTLHVFVCHFPARLKSELDSEKKRIFVAQVLRSKVDSIFRVNSSANIVIMGNFNDSPTDKSMLETLKAIPTKDLSSDRQIYNMMYWLDKKGKGTTKYQGKWSTLDQMIFSGRLLNKQKSFYTSQEDVHIFDADFLLEDDLQFYGKKPFRTYEGLKFQNGFSDHLPIYADFWY